MDRTGGRGKVFDSRFWLHDAIRVAQKRDGTTKDAQIAKILPIFGISNTSYVYKKLLPPTNRKVDESIQMEPHQVEACARELDVPNPLEPEGMRLPPSFVQYPFVGEVRAGFFAAPDMVDEVAREPVIYKRHPIYQNARPMAWLVRGKSMEDLGFVDGSVAFGVDFQDTGRTLNDGDIVVVERAGADGVERTMKVVKKLQDGIELQPRSSVAKYKPIVIKESDLEDGATIKVLTLIYKGELL